MLEDVNKDRRYAIDAAIVRTMKSRKVLQHQQLVMEVIQQLQRMFVPDLKLIKKRIGEGGRAGPSSCPAACFDPTPNARAHAHTHTCTRFGTYQGCTRDMHRQHMQHPPAFNPRPPSL